MAQASGSRVARRARSERARRHAMLATMAAEVTEAEPESAEAARISRSWRRVFLIALARHSDIAAACKAAHVTIERAYAARREEPDFAIDWRRALLEGYENLELETLFFLRTGKAPHADGKFDVANAIRLIKGQSEIAARERAAREDDDEQEVFDSIDRMLDGMRERAAANAALLGGDGDAPI